MNKHKRITLALLLAGLIGPTACAQQQTVIDDAAMGLAGSVFDTPDPLRFSYISTDPDDADSTLPVAFSDAPPQISHSIDTVMPITLDKNKCLKCHDDQAVWKKGDQKPKDEASPMPESHYTDLRHTPDEVGKKLIGSRYFCTQCHVPQAEVTPLVDNDF
jgi:cytochrome c-type protein NapB